MATRGPNLPKALAMWFPPKELAMANGICMVSMPLGVTVGMGTAAGILSLPSVVGGTSCSPSGFAPSRQDFSG